MDFILENCKKCAKISLRRGERYDITFFNTNNWLYNSSLKRFRKPVLLSVEKFATPSGKTASFRHRLDSSQGDTCVQRALFFACANYFPAVHEYVVNAFRGTVSVKRRGVVPYVLPVEDDDVCRKPLFQ